MENFTALSICCKHLNTDCKDTTYCKLKHQKHAAHSMVHRLRKKIEILELANRLLTICWVRGNRENRMLKEQISEYVEDVRQLNEGEYLSL